MENGKVKKYDSNVFLMNAFILMLILGIIFILIFKAPSSKDISQHDYATLAQSTTPTTEYEEWKEETKDELMGMLDGVVKEGDYDLVIQEKPNNVITYDFSEDTDDEVFNYIYDTHLDYYYSPTGVLVGPFHEGNSELYQTFTDNGETDWKSVITRELQRSLGEQYVFLSSNDIKYTFGDAYQKTDGGNTYHCYDDVVMDEMGVGFSAQVGTVCAIVDGGKYVGLANLKQG